MEILFIIGLIIFTFTIGSYIEKTHYVDIQNREKKIMGMPVISGKDVGYMNFSDGGEMVNGNVVISLDYFKLIWAGLKNIFGGHIRAYETLLDRGRREAVLRMKEEARLKGYNAVINMRFETSAISQVTGNKSSGCFEVLAYGTAVKLI